MSLLRAAGTALIALAFYRRLELATWSHWQAVLSFVVAVGVSAVAAAWTLGARRREAWAPALSVICALLLPGLLTPQFLPLGSGRIEALALAGAALVVIVPWLSVLWPSFWQARLMSVTGAALGVAGALAAEFKTGASMSGLHVVGVALVALSMVGQRTWMMPVLSLAIALVLPLSEEARYVGPGDEVVLEQARDEEGLTTISRSRTDGDLRLRRDRHQLLASTKTYSASRRRTLLPMRLHPRPGRVLIIGATNPAGISAALEQQPRELTVVDPSRVTLQAAKWFTSEQAANNGRTQSLRAVSDPLDYLEKTPQYFDVTVLESRPPWQRGAGEHYSARLLARARDRSYPDGVIAQWFNLYQWTEADFAGVVRQWRSQFEAREGEPGWKISLWRADLLPEYPVVALVATGGGRQSDGKKSDPRPPMGDLFLSSPAGLGALLLSDEAGLSRRLTQAPGGWGSLELRAAWGRWSGRMLPFDWALGFLSESQPSDGPLYGSLLWTRAVQRYRRGEDSWRSDRDTALKFLGFDPLAEYPGVLPGTMPMPGGGGAKSAIDLTGATRTARAAKAAD